MTIKVLSLNLWMGGRLMPAALDFLRQQAADIVLLQEVIDGKGSGLPDELRSMEVLAELGYSHQAFAEMFPFKKEGQVVPLGNAVLSKFPVIASSQRFFFESTKDSYTDEPEDWPLMPRFLQHVTVDLPDQQLHVLNVHGVWDLAGDNDSPMRQKMMDVILDEVGGHTNVIMAGDTNANAGNPIWQRLEGRLKPVFGPELKSTFNMGRKTNPGYATAAVDLMYVSPEIEVMAKDCPNVDVSDHLPIVAELGI